MSFDNCVVLCMFHCVMYPVGYKSRFVLFSTKWCTDEFRCYLLVLSVFSGAAFFQCDAFLDTVQIYF